MDALALFGPVLAASLWLLFALVGGTLFGFFLALGLHGLVTRGDR